MRMTGLEPARRRHQILSLARLPVPPHPHNLLISSVRAKRAPSEKLGQLDSNQRMQESKSCALPLGDGPIILQCP